MIRKMLLWAMLALAAMIGGETAASAYQPTHAAIEAVQKVAVEHVAVAAETRRHVAPIDQHAAFVTRDEAQVVAGMMQTGFWARGPPSDLHPVAAASDGPARGLALQAKGAAITAQQIAPASQTPLYRYMHLGDSLPQGASDQRTNTFSPGDLTSADALASQGVLLPVRSGGVGGQPSQFVAARTVRDLLKYRLDIAGLTMCTNNIVIQNAICSMADFTKVLNVANSVGTRLFVTTIPPSSVGAGDPALITSTNANIIAWAAANKVPVVDYYAISNDPANPGHYRANRTFDGRHPVMSESWAWAQADWAVIKANFIAPNHYQTRPQMDVANLLFTAISNLTGLPTNTSTRDPLFINYRTFSQNGYTLPTPYLFASLFPSGTAPGVTATVAPDASVIGNAWKITVTPNGAGSFSATTAVGGKSVDLTGEQGRRIRWSFMMMQQGANTDNTDAYLAANSNAPISGCSVTVSTRNSAGATISSLNVLDPRDPSASLGQASTIALDTQILPFANGGQGFDFSWRPINYEFSVPPGAIEGAVTANCQFKAGAISPITLGIAEMSFVDVGRADDFRSALTISNPEYGFLNVSAAKSLLTSEIFTLQMLRADATAAPFTITLPASAASAGRRITIKKMDASANAVTIATTSGETIDTATTLALSTQGKAVTLQSNGAGWDVVASTALNTLPPWWQNGRINPTYRVREPAMAG